MAATLALINSVITLPPYVVGLMFLFLSVRSRVFSVMDNSRPDLKDVELRKTPSWIPPPITFPIVWSIIAILRAAASAVVYKTMGYSLISAPLLAMLLHLSIGDTWNTINNVEKRLGTAVPGVITVLASVIFVDMLYFKASATAGLILAPSVAWLSVATVLIAEIYRLNNPGDGSEPLYPVEGRAKANWRIPLTSWTK